MPPPRGKQISGKLTLFGALLLGALAGCLFAVKARLFTTKAPPGIDRDLLAGLPAGRSLTDQPDLRKQTEALIGSDQVRELYHAGRLHPKQ